MRLRNIPGADEKIRTSCLVVKEPVRERGKWKEVFGNDHPIYLEVGMGKGQFITQLALQNPEINYIGIERYTSVLLRAIQKREKMEEIPNLLYLCIDARELPEIFEPGEVAGIYLNFSDPWPKDRHAGRRLNSKEFLERYEKVLAEGGTVEFKTDNSGLFAFGMEEVKEAGWNLLASTENLHQDAVMNEGNIMTEYEEKFSAKGNPIYKMVIRKK